MKTLDGIKKLNAVYKEDGQLLLASQIDLKELKGAKEKDLAEAFLTAIEGIPEKDEKFIPEELAELYNKLAEETAPELEAEKEVAKPAAKAAKKPEAKAKEIAKPAEKKNSGRPVKAVKKPEAKKEVAKKEVLKADDKKSVAKVDAKKALAKAEKVSGRKGRGIGAYIRNILSTKEGKARDNQSITDEVLKKFPDANTNNGCVSWYRQDMKKKGFY